MKNEKRRKRGVFKYGKKMKMKRRKEKKRREEFKIKNPHFNNINH